MDAHHELWVHGHSAEIEYPDRIASVVYTGSRVRVEGKPSTENWLHFAVPTPAIVDNSRLRPVRVRFRYRADGGGRVDAVHVYDGETRIASAEAWNTVGITGKSCTAKEVVEGNWTCIKVTLAGEILSVEWGIGISIKLAFGSGGGQLEFESAGGEFDFANPLGPQRLQIYTKKALMELPYYSNLPELPYYGRLEEMDAPKDGIERILISLHGTGANARQYLRNGLEAAQAAVDSGVDANALSNTLIVAPQFIEQKRREGRIEGDYWRELAQNILRWEIGGSSKGKESIERDLDGDGIADTGTLDSFTVMDVLLERICRRSLFPDLKLVVIAGQSRGGRFMSRYSVASRFEQEVATPRGIHVRYVIMGSGSYVYMTRNRYAFGDDTYKNAADPNCNWRDTIVELHPRDFGTVCSKDAEIFNNWPLGLDELAPYPAQVGESRIREQFVSRDVHYLIGEHDELGSNKECPERVQGQDTLAKTLLYYRHLELHCRRVGSDLKHQLHVLPVQGHDGRLAMKSAKGLAVIFGPIT